MEREIREMRSTEEIIAAKEKAIVALYAKQNMLNEEAASLIYQCSKLRNIIRDKESTLYLESAYYILERYSEYMEPISCDYKATGTISDPRAYLKQYRLLDQMFAASMFSHIFYEQENTYTIQPFHTIEKYRILRDEHYSGYHANGLQLANYIIFAGDSERNDTTLASRFAEKYKELGIKVDGKRVEINANGLILRNLVSFVNLLDMNFLIIIDGYTDIIESFLNKHPSLKTNFSNVARNRKYVDDDMLRIYKSCYKEDNSSTLEEYMNDEFLSELKGMLKSQSTVL